MATRGPEFDQLLRNPPPGVDPFSVLRGIIIQAIRPHLTQPTFRFLLICVVFHILISGFCLIILILPLAGGAARSQWVIRRFYVTEGSEEKAYQTPLYLVNPRIVMTVSQLLGSASALAYILILIKASISTQYALRSQFMPALGLMYVFELWAHWSMTHCFLVTVYYGQKNQPGNPTGLRRFFQFPRPALINALFILFPVFASTITLTFTMRVALAQNNLSDQTMEMLAALDQGASVQKELGMASESAEQKARLSAQLTTIVSEVTAIGARTAEVLDEMIHRTYITQFPLLIFTSICCLIFVILFSMVARKYRFSGHQAFPVSRRVLPLRASLKTKLPDDPSYNEPATVSQSQLGIVMSNHQFVNLALKSFAMIMAMFTAVVFSALSAAKTTEVVLDPYWHSVATWLTTVNGSLAAIPIALQCWRLYVDQVHPKSHRVDQDSLTEANEFNGICEEDKPTGPVLQIKCRDSYPL